MVLGVTKECHPDLSHIADTLGEARGFTRLGKHGEENRRQNGDNRNHD
jgi:hypothetical protein